MKSFRKAFHSLASFFNMSPDVPPPNPLDVHTIWYSPHKLSVEVAQYLLSLVNHFSTVGAVVGPDDWYVSQVEVYKNKTGLRHELLLATIQQTPRTRPQQNSLSGGHQDVISTEARQGQPNLIPDQPQASYLIIERRVDGRRAKEGASRSGSANPGEQMRDGAIGRDSSSLDDSVMGKWRGKKSAVQFFSGKKPALDEVRHTLSKGDMGDAELIGRMDLPHPPTLPHEDDSDTVFEELLGKAQTQRTWAASTTSFSSNPPKAATSSSSLCRFISILALLCLADTVSKEENYYSITGTNCYWYCSTILYSLRRHTQGTIVLPLPKGGNIIILPDDSNDTIKTRFAEAKSRFGRFGILDIVTPPEPEKIGGILREWEVNRTQTENECDGNRLQTLQKERDVVARATAEARDELDRTKKQLQEKERDVVARATAEARDELDRTRKQLQVAQDALAKHGIHLTSSRG